MASHLTTTLQQTVRCTIEEHLTHLTELEVIETLSMNMLEVLGSMETRHLEHQVTTVRSLLIGALDQARSSLAQAPVVDLIALINGILTVSQKHQVKEAKL